MFKLLAKMMLAGSVLGGCTHFRLTDRTQLIILGERIARGICPNSIPEVVAVQNRHDNTVIDRIETRNCTMGGAKIYFPKKSWSQSGLVLSVFVRSVGAGVPGYVEIGSPETEVIKYLGEPSFKDADSGSYELSPEVENTMKVSYSNGFVSTLSWSFYAD